MQLSEHLHGREPDSGDGQTASPSPKFWRRKAGQTAFLIAVIYFFFNTVGLPLGLTYMALLAPIFYIWILLKRKKDILLPFLLFLLLFTVAHIFVTEADIKKYCIALLNILAVYIFGQAFYCWLRGKDDKEKVFYKVLVINTGLCFIALLFYFTPLHTIFWIQQNITVNVEDFRRLKMFTYEASYYALLFSPLFLFYFIRYALRMNNKHNGWLLFMLFLPLVLSFSVGVILCLMTAGVVTFCIHFRTLHTKKRVVNGILTISFIAIIVLVVAYIFFRDNPVFLRLTNIFSGKDTSTTGRTADAFVLAQKILEDKSLYWGIGPGQLNLAGGDIIREYYLYHFTIPVAIPNAAAETLVLFGWIGFLVRILLQLSLFFITKVWTNYYRLLLFVFIFIYQFMGSYITNMAEYVIWILAFTNAFPELNVRKQPVITTVDE